MNISKKLLLTALFGLSMQPVAQAYNGAVLKTEITQILDFAQKLGTEAQKVAQWLENKINSINSIYDTNDTVIITIARIINSDATMDAKIAALTQKMVDELAAQAEEKAAAEKRDQEWAAENKNYENKLAENKRKEQNIYAFVAGIEVSAIAVLLYRKATQLIAQHDDALLNKASEMFRKK